MTWTLRDAKKDGAIIEKIEAGEDRSAAILAAAFIEDRLTKALLARLKDDKVVIGRMFKGYGPLATFKAKIDMAHLMEVADPATCQMLDTIREVRNRFAHRLEAHDFNIPMIRDLCDKLWSTKGIRRLKKQYNKHPNLQSLKELYTAWLDPLISIKETPRNAYMNTIKINLFVIELGTMFSQMDRGRASSTLTLVPPSPNKS